MVAYHHECRCAERGMTHVCKAEPDTTAPLCYANNTEAPLHKNRHQRRREAALARRGH